MLTTTLTLQVAAYKLVAYFAFDVFSCFFVFFSEVCQEQHVRKGSETINVTYVSFYLMLKKEACCMRLVFDLVRAEQNEQR